MPPKGKGRRGSSSQARATAPPAKRGRRASKSAPATSTANTDQPATQMTTDEGGDEQPVDVRLYNRKSYNDIFAGLTQDDATFNAGEGIRAIANAAHNRGRADQGADNPIEQATAAALAVAQANQLGQNVTEVQQAAKAAAKLRQQRAKQQQKGNKPDNDQPTSQQPTGGQPITSQGSIQVDHHRQQLQQQQQQQQHHAQQLQQHPQQSGLMFTQQMPFNQSQMQMMMKGAPVNQPNSFTPQSTMYSTTQHPLHPYGQNPGLHNAMSMILQQQQGAGNNGGFSGFPPGAAYTTPTMMVPQSHMTIPSSSTESNIDAARRDIAGVKGAARPTAATTDDEKKARRLYKNKLAAKECRRKKKEMVDRLKDRVKLLEKQNSCLQQELGGVIGLLPKDQQENLKRRLTGILQMVDGSQSSDGMMRNPAGNSHNEHMVHVRIKK